MNRNQQSRPKTMLRDVCLAVSRHRKKAAAFFLLVMAITILVTVLVPKTYVSESKLFVRLGREDLVPDSAATLRNSPVEALLSWRESEINSVAEILASRAILEHVVGEVGAATILDGIPEAVSNDSATAGGAVQWLAEMGRQVRGAGSEILESLRNAVSSSSLTVRDRALERLQKKLTVEPGRKSNVVCVTFEASQPELARQVVASAVDAYLKEHARLNRTRGTHEFFTDHAKRLAGDLERLESELKELKTSTGLVSADEQRTQIVSRIGRLEDELLTTGAARREAEARVDALREKLANVAKEQVVETRSGNGNNGTDLIREKIFALQVREKEAAAVYTANHPKLQMIREELAEAARIMAEQEPTGPEVKTAPDAVYEQTRLALTAEEPLAVALRARTESIQTQLADVRTSLDALNANEVRIARLKREIDLRDADYRKYAANLEQARIDQTLDPERMSSIIVVQPASLEPRAIRPRRVLNVLLGLMVALGGAVAVPLFAECLRRSLQPRDVPVQETPPRIVYETIKTNGKKREEEVRRRR